MPETKAQRSEAARRGQPPGRPTSSSASRSATTVRVSGRSNWPRRSTGPPSCLMMCSSHLRLGRGPRSRRFVSSSALRRRLRSRSDRQTGCVLSARGAGERASRQGLPPPH